MGSIPSSEKRGRRKKKIKEERGEDWGRERKRREEKPGGRRRSQAPRKGLDSGTVRLGRNPASRCLVNGTS